MLERTHLTIIREVDRQGSLTAAANGFSQVQEKITIGVGERIRLDLHLTVGGANQTVEVNATGLDLQRDDASIGIESSSLVRSTTYAGMPLLMESASSMKRDSQCSVRSFHDRYRGSIGMQCPPRPGPG